MKEILRYYVENTSNPSQKIQMSYSDMLKLNDVNQIKIELLPLLDYDELTYLAYVYYLKLVDDKLSATKDQIDYNRLRHYRRLPEQVEQIECKMQCLYNLFYQINLEMLANFMQANKLPPLSIHDKKCFRFLGDMILYNDKYKQYRGNYLDLAIVMGVNINDEMKMYPDNMTKTAVIPKESSTSTTTQVRNDTRCTPLVNTASFSPSSTQDNSINAVKSVKIWISIVGFVGLVFLFALIILILIDYHK